MQENIILSRQKEANLGRIFLIREGYNVELGRPCQVQKSTADHSFFSSFLYSWLSAITMLPAMTYGFISAYITIALPKYQQANPTGVILDLNQISWIGKKIYNICCMKKIKLCLSLTLTKAHFWGRKYFLHLNLQPPSKPPHPPFPVFLLYATTFWIYF